MVCVVVVPVFIWWPVVNDWCVLLAAKQATDSNAAAWAAYYAQLYGQAGAAGQQQPAQQQQPPQQQQQPVGAYGTPASSAPAAQPQPS